MAVKLSPAQLKFIELDKQKAEIKKFLLEYSAAAKAVIAEQGIGVFFQDEEGTVYKTAEAKGEYVHYKSFEILRTRRADEKTGTLALTEAKDAGFEVGGK